MEKTSGFSNHYLRLGASHKASHSISNLVHNISHGNSAEPDMSRTPRKSYFDLGGRDMEGEAQEPCEIMLSLPADCLDCFLLPVKKA